MKKLLMTLAACATALLASAAITTSEGFEGTGLGGFSGTGGSAVAYDTAPSLANYPFADAGSKYCEIDADGTDTLSSPTASGATYFDMYIQFPANASEPDPELDSDAKLAVYVNSDNKLVVLSGGETPTNVTETTITPGAWARLTIAQVTGGYQVYVDGEAVSETAFTPIISGAPSTVAFTGCGKLDNFVARTTNPFYTGNYAASVGTGADNEKYATYSDALADVLSSGATDAITIAGETPKTVNGTAANPYEITNLADLKAFQAAIAATNGVDKCYTLTADIALDAPWDGIGLKNGKDVYNTAAFNTAAFCGTFDGQNHTISGFQMVGGGLDYCGFFNSTYNATIKNLKIQYAGALFAADTTASTLESGATFVGVAKGSTLQNLTSLQKDAETAVSSSKGFGGIVGYLTSGTTVDSCTNNLNMTSLANNKCGGIAMITQNGNAVTIRNCQNNGTQTTGSSNSEYGAIVGYVGLDTTIANCETTVGRFLKHQGNTVTLQGVNKGDARVASYHGAATPGLNFATVNGDVATFVADDALAAGNTYKVMGPTATATYVFTDLGSISFDTSLATPTYAITVANPNMFDVTSATEEDVTTYTAAGGTAVASLTKNEETTEYNTIAKALDAAENGDTVNLETDSSEDVSLPTGVSLALNEHTYSGTISAAANGYAVTQVDGVYAVVENTASTWVGESGGLWATASNWSTGAVPDQYTTVTFNGDADVGIGSGNDTRSVAALVVNGNVTFHHDTRNYAYYPSVKTYGSVTGTGTVILERCGLCGNGSEVTVGCDLVFKGDSATSHDSFLQSGPFVLNGGVSSTLGRLHLITPVTFNGAVNLVNATITSAISGGSAPTFNGAVTLGAGASILTYAVTYNNALTIGEGAIVSVGSTSQTYGENFTMTGSGRFIGDTQMPGSKVLEALTQSTWTGTLELKGMTIKQTNGLQTYGNADSKVCFNNVTTYLHREGNAVGGIEVGAGGLKVNGNYSAGDWNLPELSGVGTFTVGTAGNGNKNFNFPADCSEFSGSIAFASDTANTRVVFGTTDREFKAKTICVGSDAIVGAGASWVAGDEIYIDGIVKASAATSLSTVVGSGKIVYGAVPTGTHTFGEGWTGIGALDYKGAGRIDLANYVNTIAEKCSCDTVEVVEGCTMSLNNYFGADVTPTLKVSGFVVINDGSSTTKCTVSNLTGDGVLVFGTKGAMVNYAVDNVVGWNGVITNSASSTLVTNLVSGAGTVVYNVAASTAIGAGFSGEVEYAVAPSAAPAVDAESEATVYLNFNYAGMNIAPYGNAKSTIKLGDLSATNAYLNDGSGSGTGQIPSKVIVAGDVTINNAWPLGSADWTSKKVVRFGNRLKVDGSLTFESTQSTWTGYGYYRADVLDASGAGRITVGNRFALRIDAVDFAEAPSGTDVLVDLTLAGDTAGLLYGPNGVAGEQIPVTVNGEATEQTLVYDAVKGGLVLYVAPTPKVAEVVDGEQYETLAGALAAATDGATVKLLANITLDARVEPNLGAGTALTIDLGGYTITREGTSGNGSVFDVKSGNVVITNGVIDCTQDDTAIVADGVYAITARSGANVTLGGLTVTVDSQAGACVYPFAGAQVTILSGTYANTTQDAYQYKSDWTGMAVNQVNKNKDGGVLTQRITIYGGSFKQVNPALGDDSWADGEGTFLASGYAATWNTSNGSWDVAEVQEVPVTPGAQTEPVETQAEAEAAAAKVVPSVPAAVAEALSDDQETAYKALFEPKVVEVTVGETTKYAVEVALKDTVVTEIQTAVDAEAEDLAKAAVAAAADATNGGEAAVATKPGLYYVVEAGSEVNGITPASCTLATSTETKLNIPNKGTKGFYKISVSVTPVVVQE